MGDIPETPAKPEPEGAYPVAAKYQIYVRYDAKEWAVPLLSGTRWRIGRASECELSTPDRLVSNEHAELVMENDRLILRRTQGKRPIEMGDDLIEEKELDGGAAFVIGRTRFSVARLRDGMQVLDTRTVLSGVWGAPKLTAPNDAEASTVRLMAQLFQLLRRVQDRATLAESLLKLACKHLTATRALLARVGDIEHLDVISSHGLPGEAKVKDLVSTTVLKRILDERQAVCIGNTAKIDTGLSRQESIVRNHIQAVACTPVFSALGNLEALLYLDNQDRPAEFSPADMEVLVWFGQIYSLLDEHLTMRRQLEDEVSALKRDAFSGARMIAESPAMLDLLERVKKAAVSDVSILILGESGTGKECIARFLHAQSERAGKPFVARNCAATPENLFESEMFGHRKGAFTGADRDRTGAFVEADDGTLFLDEIGDLDYPLQTKLLRALQERVARPVGSDKDVPITARIICATNRDLREACRDRSFRQDLFYRIATVTLTVPPLRERREDILPLARHFVRVLSDDARRLTPPAENELLDYPWPGNVRELRSCVEQAVIFAAGTEIRPDDLNLPSPGNATIDLGDRSLAEMERRHILKILEGCNGNKTEAARVLGLARSTLVVKLKAIERTRR